MPWTKVFLNQESLERFAPDKGLRSLSYVESLREAQSQLLAADNETFLIGEGVDDPGGVFGSTRGLVDEFGCDRVMDIPIAENGLTGVAIGAATAGMRPVFVHMRMDFLPMCMDQIINHAAKWHYMSGGSVCVPLVIRAIIGRGWGSAAQHSQALHGLFLHVPGIRIVIPATPYDVKGLLVEAVRSNDPVLFVEHRWLYDTIGFVPPEMYRLPFGRGIVRQEGTDCTIVAFSQMLYEAMEAAKSLSDAGISAEVIDPRTINPLDHDLIFSSVNKTGRLIIADPACRTGGVGAEIVCRLNERDSNVLQAPVRRINFADTPTPCSPVLEEIYYPDAQAIFEAAKEICA